MLERLVADVIEALRALKADALIVTAAVVTLAASIAINVAMFGLIDRALVSPPPHIARPDRLFSLTFQAPGQSEGEAGMSASPVFADGRIYFLDEEGRTTVITPGKSFQQISLNVLDGPALASMAVASQSFFIRTATHLYRIASVIP